MSRVAPGAECLEFVKSSFVAAETSCMTRRRAVQAMLRVATVATSLSFLTIGLLAAEAIAVSTSTSAPRVDPSGLRYTVKRGDYLTGIARKLGVTLPDLLAVNNLTVASVIVPGAQLVVPAGGALPAETGATVPTAAATPPAPAAAAVAYTVKSGDYLSKIASRLGVTLPQLLAANGIEATALIRPGDSLAVPANGKLPVEAAPGTPAAPATTSYIVKTGDFLIGIATANGVTLKALLASNSMTVTSSILPGRQLVMPPATLPIPAAPAAPAAAPVDGSPTSTQLATVVAFLQAQAGKAYAFNTEGPDTYDCSGLVRAAYLQIGISLPHQSLLLSTKGVAVDWQTEDLRPGDLVFQYSSNNPTVISHVGIAITSTTWIQAARSGVPIKIGLIPSDERIVSVRRIVTG
jgi:LysM repeat protein